MTHAVFAATLMLSCPVSSLRLMTSGNPAMDLQEDEVFNKLFPEQKNITTVSDSCHSFKGKKIECYKELPEHALARSWIPVNATVMEFGARFGTTTCEIAKQIGNSGRLVAVEPDANVYGALQGNLESNNCHAHLLRGVVASVPQYISTTDSRYGTQTRNTGSKKKDVKVPNFSFEEIEHVLGMTFDTMLIDCEGCIQNIMDVLRPKIQRDINLLLLEADYPAGITKHGDKMDYEPFKHFMTESGFDIVDSFNDCDQERYAPHMNKLPCEDYIWHYVFLRRSKY